MLGAFGIAWRHLSKRCAANIERTRRDRRLPRPAGERGCLGSQVCRRVPRDGRAVAQMTRMIGWFSCGAASAVAVKLTRAEPVYCDTGAEHPDNERFLVDCERWFGRLVTRLRSDRYSSTWDVWQQRRYLAGIEGAPCTVELKIMPRLAFQRPDDVHVFGYTADAADAARATRLRANYPELSILTPLIDRGLTKAACIAM